MTKYKVTVYPNVESDIYEVEADTIAEAIMLAENYAVNNCFFIATEDDVEELEEQQ